MIALHRCSLCFLPRYTAKPLVQSVLAGAMATCFAYGQVGSGKTYTMRGNLGSALAVYNPIDVKGMCALAAGDIFCLVQSDQYRDKNYVVAASFCEISEGKVRSRDPVLRAIN